MLSVGKCAVVLSGILINHNNRQLLTLALIFLLSPEMTSFILQQQAKFHVIQSFVFFSFWPTGEEAATAETAFMLLAV